MNKYIFLVSSSPKDIAKAGNSNSSKEEHSASKMKNHKKVLDRGKPGMFSETFRTLDRRQFSLFQIFYLIQNKLRKPIQSSVIMTSEFDSQKCYFLFLDDVMPGLKIGKEPLPPHPLSGMLNKHGKATRLTFKLDMGQVWIGTKERTEKVPLSSIKNVVSEPIEGEKHIALFF